MDVTLPAKLTDALLELPETDRLELARVLVESVGGPEESAVSLEEVVRRLEDLVTGKAQALSEDEFRRELS